MKKIIMALTAVCVLLQSTVALAGINQLPEVDDMIVNGRKDDINKFIRRDDTGNIDFTAYTTIEVDDNTITGPAYKEILGHGGEGFTYYDDIMLDDNGEISEEYKKLCEEDFYDAPTARFGGHHANYYSLIHQIGSDRQVAQWQLNAEDTALFHPECGKPEFPTMQAPTYQTGTIEFIKGMQVQNPDISFIFCISLTHENPEDVLNFVSFCRDDPSESSYGKLRESYGLDKVNIFALELGNELYMNNISYGADNIKDRASWYIRRSIEYMETVHAKYPEIEFSPCIGGDMNESKEHGDTMRHVWNEPIMDALSPYCKYFTTHLYYCGYEPAYCTLAYKYQQDYFDEILGKGHGKQLLITEHSKWIHDTQWSTASTLESALCTAQYLNTLYAWPDQFIRAANYYNFSTTKHWALMRRADDGTLVTTAVGKMYDVFLKGLGDRVVKTTSIPKDDSEICNKESTQARFLAQAYAKDDKTLKIIMTNRQETGAVDIDFNFLRNKYTLKSETVFTAPNTLSFIYGQDSKDIFTTTTTEKNEANFKHYVMPNKSMVVLTLESTSGKIPQFGEDPSAADGETTYDGEERFSDIKYHWANAEINLLAEGGVVSGNGTGEFKPDARISKAEFAAMLCKVIGTDADIAADIGDVHDTDWFCDYAKTLVGRGYVNLSNGVFNPYGEINLKDALIAIYRACAANTADMAVTDSQAVAARLGLSDDTSAWVKDVFAYALQNGFLSKFYEISGVEPTMPLTRAQAAVLVYRLKAHLGI